VLNHQVEINLGKGLKLAYWWFLENEGEIRK